jgi:serine/threonine protein kinase
LNGARALVMELVEGPTLADRIAQGPISVDEASPIARQITKALKAAHETTGSRTKQRLPLHTGPRIHLDMSQSAWRIHHESS